MYNLDWNLHRDMEDTLYYHSCVAFWMRKLLCQDVCRLMGSLGHMNSALGHNVLYSTFVSSIGVK